MRRHGFLTVLAASVGALWVAFSSSVHALQYGRVPLEGHAVVITFTGPIVEGDLDRLAAFVRALPADDSVVGVALDSPGGSLAEAARLLPAVYQVGWLAFVPANSECSSSCFLLFAAAAKRFVAPDALIGIHSASERGQDTAAAKAATTEMARLAGALGVPSAIIGRMVQTVPGRMTWLTPTELASWDVVILSDTKKGSPAVATPGSSAATPKSAGEKPAAAPSAVPVAHEDWSSYGNWIQLYSERGLSDAAQRASGYETRLASKVHVFQAENAIFAGVLGPFAADDARRTLDQLIRAGTIPTDSYVTSGARYVALVWGDRLQLKSSPVVGTNGNASSFRVTGVANNDVLFLRSGAGTSFPVVVAIPPNGRAVAVGKCQTLDGFANKWCQATWQTYSGWASACCLVNEVTGRPPD